MSNQPANPEISSLEVTLREITEPTLKAILRLEVADHQKNLVASNAVSIAQAYFSKNAWFRAIYAGETPVGFVMLYLDETKLEYFLWRYMIDKQQQGKGYGRQALQQVIEHVRRLPGAKEFYLSYVPEEGSALPFYQKLGFVETGDWEDGEKIMKLNL
ncbi:MAG: GNAT family N-acetyltransferase [Anaerolineae bacterium]|nr:GNAT family N-acetyltransferase [Anaerolineae bacterium]